MSALSERAMLVSLSIGMPSASVVDREATDEVNEQHNAEKDAGRYAKHLFSNKALRPINQSVSNSRITHRVLTLPWNDDGTRILSTRAYKDYTASMKICRLTFEARVKDFVKHLPEHIIEAKERLGTLFDAADYPSVDVLKGKFYLRVEPSPVPEGGDFRAKISDDEAKAVIKSIERRQKERLDVAMDDIYNRIGKLTARMADRLKNYKPAYSEPGQHDVESKFRDSLVSDVRELAEAIPVLNLTDDPRISKLQEQILTDLCKHEAQELRDDAKVRARTAKKAEAIFDKVKQYMN